MLFEVKMIKWLRKNTQIFIININILRFLKILILLKTFSYLQFLFNLFQIFFKWKMSSFTKSQKKHRNAAHIFSSKIFVRKLYIFPLIILCDNFKKIKFFFAKIPKAMYEFLKCKKKIIKNQLFSCFFWKNVWCIKRRILALCWLRFLLNRALTEGNLCLTEPHYHFLLSAQLAVLSMDVIWL